MKDESDRRTARLVIYLTEEQKQKVEAKAKRRGIVASSKLRELVLEWADDGVQA